MTQATKPSPVAQEEKTPAVDHLEALRHDVRDEIKIRIKQRDQYSIQLTVALSALVAIATTATATFTDTTTTPSPSPTTSIETSIISFTYRVLLAAPLVSIYFTILILYSYRVHGILASYLRDEIEPELARLCGTSLSKEWEAYYAAHAVPGIRKPFFIGALWVVCVASPLYIGFAENWQGGFIVPLGIFALIYALVAAWMTKTFWKG